MYQLITVALGVGSWRSCAVVHSMLGHQEEDVVAVLLERCAVCFCRELDAHVPTLVTQHARKLVLHVHGEVSLAEP